MSVNTLKLKKPVILIGMMGSGKTTIGQAIAEKIGVEFVDSDHEIERDEKCSIADIFEAQGEAYFRTKEHAMIAKLLTSAPAIISTGGGAFMQHQTRKLICEHGVTIWLKVDLDLLWERVRYKTTRPLLNTYDPYRTLEHLLQQRTAIYEQASITVEVKPEYSIGDTTSHVIDTLCHANLLETVSNDYTGRA